MKDGSFVKEVESSANLGRISIVVPVLNEAESLPRFLSDLDRILNEISPAVDEVVFVDDGSTDGTLDLLSSALKTTQNCYSIKVIERKQVRGTVDAELCGCRNASNPLIIKLDGDGQHPPFVIRNIINAWSNDSDVIVASRYIRGGGRLWSPQRELISRGASFVAYILIPNSRRLGDPMSGYFMVKKSLVKNLASYRNHYKLLLYLLASSKNLKVREVSYTMKERKGGESKIANSKSGFVVNYLREVFGYYLISRKERY